MSSQPSKALVTGAAGFIGSHVAQEFLRQNWQVIGLDDLSSGLQSNLDAIAHDNFTFIEGDIRDFAACKAAAEGVNVVLHHAAIGSVVKSIEDPGFVEAVNVGGFRNILEAAEIQGIQRVVYASSCAVYGDTGAAAAIDENQVFNPLSPYAEGKIRNEIDARDSALETIGFRYFNIYGARQDPSGAYAAVLPKWMAAMAAGAAVQIFGDGQTIRDFCHVSDVVQANFIAATLMEPDALNQIYNIGSGQGTTLNRLFALIKAQNPAYDQEPVYKDFREGDIRSSKANITKAQTLLSYEPQVKLEEGLGSL